ncbi:hypothetical protein RJ035_003906 [Blastomyces gilchristii]
MNISAKQTTIISDNRCPGEIRSKHASRVPWDNPIRHAFFRKPCFWCLDAAIEDGTNTVFMAIGGELNVDENMVASASQVLDIRKRLKSRACEDPRLENQLAEEEEEL